MAAVERQQARIARAVAVKQATIDYHAKVASELAKAALELVETVVGDPMTGQEWADAPIPLVKLAAVEGSGISVNGARLLADECWKRAAVLEPGRFGPKAGLGDNRAEVPPEFIASLLRMQRDDLLRYVTGSVVATQSAQGPLAHDQAADDA